MNIETKTPKIICTAYQSSTRRRLHAVVTTAALLIANLASATIEEVIVTANKREQSLQDIPVSVSVTSAEQIQQSSIVDLIDLQTAVPTLRVSQLQSSAQTNFIIRGFGNGANNPGIEPAVGIYIDGVARTRSASALADLPTIERVEVLSGPQSTLFGKNASAGVISVSTLLPEEEAGGMLEVTAGNYGSKIVKGTVTDPVTDTIAYRLSASSNSSDGYADNLFDNSDVNNRNRSAVRGQLLIEPSDDLSIRVIADWNDMDEECCAASSLVYGSAAAVSSALAGGLQTPIDPWARDLYMNFSPNNKLEDKGLSVELDYDLSFATLTSITATRDQSVRSNFDADFSAADLVEENRTDYDFDTLTQEVRLTSNGEGPLQWMVGGYYSREDVATFRNVTYGTQMYDYADFLVTAGLSAAIASQAIEGYLAAGFPAAGAEAFGASAVASALGPVGGSGLNYVGAAFGVCVVNTVSCRDIFFVPGTGDVAENFTMDSRTYSLFGQIEYPLTDALTLTLGLDYTDDSKDVSANVQIIDAFAGLPLDTAGLGALSGLQFFKAFPNYPNGSESGRFDSDDLTHTLRLSYDLSDTIKLYVNHATGFKAASVNMTIDRRIPGQRAADPEEAEVYEIGIKTEFENGYFNLAYFNQSIAGFQSNVFSGVGFDLVNAGKQTHEGVEFDSIVALSENLVLGLSGIFIDPVYDSFSHATCDTTGLAGPEYQCPEGESSVDLTGLTPAGIHRVSINANTVYSFAVSDQLAGFARLEYVYDDDIAIVDLIPRSLASRGSNNVNDSVGVSSEQRGWDAMIWGRNLTDHQSLISAFPTTASSGSFSGYPNAPRTFGLTVRKNF